MHEPQMVGEGRAKHPRIATATAMALGLLDCSKYLGVRHRRKRVEVSTQTIAQPGPWLLRGLSVAWY
jgi:hypothetical protein